MALSAGPASVWMAGRVGRNCGRWAWALYVVQQKVHGASGSRWRQAGEGPWMVGMLSSADGGVIDARVGVSRATQGAWAGWGGVGWVCEQ